MKKVAYIFLLVLIISVSSCSVYEDYYFMENGKMKYDMTVDASELMSMLGASSVKQNSKYMNDTVLNLSQLVKDSLKTIPADFVEDLKNIEPIYVKTIVNESTKDMKVSIFGEFDDAIAFTRAFSSLSKLSREMKSDKGDAIKKITENNNIFANSSLTWDGRTLSRIISGIEKDNDSSEITDNEGNSESASKTQEDELLTRLFSQGKMVVKYHFPKKIKSISNNEATFSMDGKTAIIHYPANIFLEPTSSLSIEIETE